MTDGPEYQTLDETGFQDEYLSLPGLVGSQIVIRKIRAINHAQHGPGFKVRVSVVDEESGEVPDGDGVLTTYSAQARRVCGYLRDKHCDEGGELSKPVIVRVTQSGDSVLLR
tara:strand:+ start:128 stop:463 length:336 start_codon:yes stop_codon:yes gene_type:complete